MALKSKSRNLYTIGSDPELFLQRADTKEPLPVCGLIGGTKKKPLPMEGMPDGFAVQEDNVMLEFNIPCAISSSDMIRSIQNSMLHIFTTVRDKLGAEILPNSAVLFPTTLLFTAQAHIFGCSPDFNGHRGGEKYAPVDTSKLREGNGEWRFAGGHIHLGYQPRGIPEYVAAQFADVFL